MLRTETLTARIVNTKVEVNAAGKFSWTAGDEIAVYRTVNGYETATLNGDGAFNVHLADGEARDGYAVYPASIATDAAALTVNLPATYTIPKTGMADYSPLPMIAVNDPASDDLLFHHLGGIIRLVLDKVPYETQKIVVNLGKKVTGDFVVDNPASDTPSIALSAGTAEDITFTLASPVNSATLDGVVINIPVPVGAYEEISVKLYDRYDQFIQDMDEEINVTVERADGYEASADLHVDVSKIPLCFKMAREGQLIVSNPLGLTMEYSRDNVTWTSFNSDLTFDLVRGNQVYFRGNNPTYTRDDPDNNYHYYNADSHTNFRTTAKCYFYGNIMSLITPDPDDFSELKSLSEPYTFYELFFGELEGIGSLLAEPKLFSHPSFDLLLPATTLTESCYQNMFSFTGVDRMELPATTMKKSCYESMFIFCNKILTAPELPATTLAEECYQCMFENCYSLVNAPSLPATTLAENCYSSMFSSCLQLEVAPELPALTMEKSCYRSMFSNCSKMVTAPSLPATTLAEWCYCDMFEDCHRLINAPSLPATELAGWCYSQMFNDCRSLVRAPELPAKSLVLGCYQEMFKDCQSLQWVKAMFTDWEDSGLSHQFPVENWLSGVSETGTFEMNDAATYDPVADAGVPSTWTINRVTE